MLDINSRSHKKQYNDIKKNNNDKNKCTDIFFPEKINVIDANITINSQLQAKQVVSFLTGMYPEADCTLDYREPWKLLISGILAAQCTDARVNIVCKSLFIEFPTIESIANADVTILEDRIHSCGFYHVKAKSIKGSMQKLLSEYQGMVPSNLGDLVSLPGVGRKIGNLILGDCFGKQAIVVDTHCARIARHIGLTDSTTPEKIERDLMKCIPENEWTNFGHRIVAHGRAVCTAKNPKCNQCQLKLICKKGIQSIE